MENGEIFFFLRLSESFLEGLTKELPLKIAEHCKVEGGHKRLKETVKYIFKSKFVFDKCFAMVESGASDVCLKGYYSRKHWWL